MSEVAVLSALTKVSLADIHDMLAQLLGVSGTQHLVINPLQALLRSSRCRQMARVAIPARRFELWARMVREDVSSLSVREAIGAIRNRVARDALHIVHLPQTTDRVLYEEKAGVKLSHHVRTSEAFKDHVCRQLHDVDMERGRKPLIPIDRETLIPPCSKRIRQAFRAAE